MNNVGIESNRLTGAESRAERSSNLHDSDRRRDDMLFDGTQLYWSNPVTCRYFCSSADFFVYVQTFLCVDNHLQFGGRSTQP